MNSINVNDILNNIHNIEQIEYYDGKVDKLFHIKKTRERIRQFEQQLLYVDDMKNSSTYHRRTHHKDIDLYHKVLKKLNKNKRIYDVLKNDIQKNKNKIKSIVYEYFNDRFYIKLKDGRIHSDYGPAIIQKYSHKITQYYYLNDIEISRKDWIIYNRKLKINKVLVN